MKKPTITVAGADGKTIAPSNYTVSYSSGCKKVGEYSVSISFKGNYSGDKALSFTINPKKPSISKKTAGKKKVKVKMSKKPSATGGSAYQINYRVKGTEEWKSATTKKRTRTIKKLEKGKKYQIRVRAYKTVNGKNIYGAWSKVKTTKKVK